MRAHLVAYCPLRVAGIHSYLVKNAFTVAIWLCFIMNEYAGTHLKHLVKFVSSSTLAIKVCFHL
jgi:hypothetical protein